MFTYYSVSDAIARNQTEKLGELMENYFFSSFGGDCTVEKTSRVSGDPRRMPLLGKVLSAGCAPAQYDSEGLVSAYVLQHV